MQQVRTIVLIKDRAKMPRLHHQPHCYWCHTRWSPVISAQPLTRINLCHLVNLVAGGILIEVFHQCLCSSAVRERPGAHPLPSVQNRNPLFSELGAHSPLRDTWPRLALSLAKHELGLLAFQGSTHSPTHCPLRRGRLVAALSPVAEPRQCDIPLFCCGMFLMSRAGADSSSAPHALV